MEIVKKRLFFIFIKVVQCFLIVHIQTIQIREVNAYASRALTCRNKL